MFPAHWSALHVGLVPNYPSQSHLPPSLHSPWTTADESKPPAPSPSPSASKEKEQNQIFGIFSEWHRGSVQDWVFEADPGSSKGCSERADMLTIVSLCTLTSQVFSFVASPISLPTFLSPQHLPSLSTLVYSPVKCCSPLMRIFFFSGFFFFFL